MIYIRNRQRKVSLNLPKIKRKLNRALLLLGYPEAELSVMFVNASVMRGLNARFLGRDSVTDVLSFPMEDKASEEKNIILGDIVVCIPRALTQAAEYGLTFHEELLRLLIHGLLHLAGYEHEKGLYQKKKMEKKEKELIRALATMA